MLKFLGLVSGVLMLGLAPAMAQTSCTAQSQAQLLTSFSDAAAPGSITPQTLRNFVCSTTGLLPAGVVQLPIYTVATLPVCNSNTTGTLASVTDATSPTYNAALTGGSTVHIPVFCNGTAWSAH